MTLNELIGRLQEIKEEYDCGDVETFVMEEHDVEGNIIQFESDVRDVSASVGNNEKCSRVIVIGQELL